MSAKLSIVSEEKMDANTNNDERRAELARARDTHRSSLERLYEALDDPNVFMPLTTAKLRIYQERINRHFENFEQADAEYRDSCILITDQALVEVERHFMAVMSRINNRLDELTNHKQISDEPINSEQANIEQINTQVVTNLPGAAMLAFIRVETAREPQIGKFDGNPADWPAFRDIFMAEVHNKALDPVTKLLYLQGACVDKAARHWVHGSQRATIMRLLGRLCEMCTKITIM